MDLTRDVFLDAHEFSRTALIDRQGYRTRLSALPEAREQAHLSARESESRGMRGSTVNITAIYDNSAANNANPDPAKLVKWGSQTVDEMMIGDFEYFLPLPVVTASK